MRPWGIAADVARGRERPVDMGEREGLWRRSEFAFPRQKRLRNGSRQKRRAIPSSIGSHANPFSSSIDAKRSHQPRGRLQANSIAYASVTLELRGVLSMPGLQGERRIRFNSLSRRRRSRQATIMAPRRARFIAKCLSPVRAFTSSMSRPQPNSMSLVATVSMDMSTRAQHSVSLPATDATKSLLWRK